MTPQRQADKARWLEILPDAALVVCDAVIVYANQAARSLFDPGARRALTGETASRLLPQPVAGDVPVPMCRLDGSGFARPLFAEPTTVEGRPATLYVVRGPADLPVAADPRDAEDRALRALPGWLIHVQEHERRQIAQELHEEIGQCLSAIRVQFARLQRRVEEPQVLSLIDSAAQMTERTLGRVRSLSLLLHPPQLETLGLAAALSWHVQEQQRLHGLPILFRSGPVDDPLDPEIAIAVYRIVQEALSNALRHAGAVHVTVTLATIGDLLEVSIADDGRGLDTDALEARGHPTLGLLSMQERARLVGGTLILASQPGKGTQIAARLPLKPVPRHDQAPSRTG